MKFYSDLILSLRVFWILFGVSPWQALLFQILSNFLDKMLCFHTMFS